MTVELITGYSGTPHIGSDDVQHLIAGIVGGGSYALDTGKKLAIAVNSANSVTVDTGDAIIAGGAHVRVAAAEKLTVTSGAQGVKRNDLVCLRYTKASDNKESAALVVVKGTATSGTPTDPAYNTGSIIDGKATVDMPLYRLPLDGVSLGTPVKLFSVSPTLASLGDSVSRFHVVTGTVVRSFTSDFVKLFSLDDVSDNGVPAPGAPSVVITNGDNRQTTAKASAEIDGSGNVYANFNYNPNTTMRLNWAVLWSD